MKLLLFYGRLTRSRVGFLGLLAMVRLSAIPASTPGACGRRSSKLQSRFALTVPQLWQVSHDTGFPLA